MGDGSTLDRQNCTEVTSSVIAATCTPRATAALNTRAPSRWMGRPYRDIMRCLQHATSLKNHDSGTCKKPEARTPDNGTSIFGNGAFCCARHYIAQTVPWA